MATTLGGSAVVQVSTNDSSYSTVACNSVSLNVPREYADVSKMGDTGKRQMSGLRDFSGSISGPLDWNDAGQGAIKTAVDAGNLLWVKVLSDGTNGYKCKCALKFKVDSKFGSQANEVSFDFEQADGAAPVAVP